MLTRALTAAVLIASLAVERVEAIPKITVNGAKFFRDTGDQFYITGPKKFLSLSLYQC